MSSDVNFNVRAFRLHTQLSAAMTAYQTAETEAERAAAFKLVEEANKASALWRAELAERERNAAKNDQYPMLASASVHHHAAAGAAAPSFHSRAPALGTSTNEARSACLELYVSTAVDVYLKAQSPEEKEKALELVQEANRAQEKWIAELARLEKEAGDKKDSNRAALASARANFSSGNQAFSTYSVHPHTATRAAAASSYSIPQQQALGAGAAASVGSAHAPAASPKAPGSSTAAANFNPSYPQAAGAGVHAAAHSQASAAAAGSSHAPATKAIGGGKPPRHPPLKRGPFLLSCETVIYTTPAPAVEQLQPKPPQPAPVSIPDRPKTGVCVATAALPY